MTSKHPLVLAVWDRRHPFHRNMSPSTTCFYYWLQLPCWWCMWQPRGRWVISAVNFMLFFLFCERLQFLTGSWRERLDFRKVVKFASRDRPGTIMHPVFAEVRSWRGCSSCVCTFEFLCSGTTLPLRVIWLKNKASDSFEGSFKLVRWNQWKLRSFVTCRANSNSGYYLKSWPVHLSESVFNSKEFPWSRFSA
jgi:hypothetical protein